MKQIKEVKVSAMVALAVTVLAVVTALVFSLATITYQREVSKLSKLNKEYKATIQDYQLVVTGIKKQLEKAPEK